MVREGRVIMDEKEKPSPEIAKAKGTKCRSVLGDHNLYYKYKNNGYGIVGRNCKIEISIITDMPFSEIVQEFVKASEAVCEDLSQRNTTE